MDSQYGFISLFALVSLLITVAVVLSPFIIGKLLRTSRKEREKFLPYECGFDPDFRVVSNFDVKFYLTAIFFVIFDLEIVMLFPWSMTLDSLGKTAYFVAMGFFTLLTVGFVYEWKSGALDWS